MGPDSFDCSGFVIASLSESLGVSISDWPREYRHVREFWGEGRPSIGDPVSVDEVEIGDILIFQRRITVEGVRDLFPCHASIVSVGLEGEGLKFIGTSHEAGCVIEVPLDIKQEKRMLGAIAINPEKIYNWHS